MTCHDACEQLSAWVDEALTAEERARVDAHLTACADCRRELERLRKTVALLRAVEPAHAPAGFVDRVLAAARPEPWPRRLLRRLVAPLPAPLPIGAAAAMLVAVAAVYLVERTPDLQQAARPQASFPVAREVGSTAAPSPAPAAGARPAAPPARRKEQAPAKQEADRPPAPPAPLAKDAKVAEPASPPSPPGAKAAESLAAAPPPGTVAPEGRASELATRQEARPDAPEEKAKSAPVPGVHRFSARALVSVDVAGRLAVRDREAGARALADLVARLQGRQLARWPDPGTPGVELVEIVIPRAAYAEFTAELARLGQWVPEREALESPEYVRVVVRLTD